MEVLFKLVCDNRVKGEERTPLTSVPSSSLLSLLSSPPLQLSTYYPHVCSGREGGGCYEKHTCAQRETTEHTPEAHKHWGTLEAYLRTPEEGYRRYTWGSPEEVQRNTWGTPEEYLRKARGIPERDRRNAWETTRPWWYYQQSFMLCRDFLLF